MTKMTKVYEFNDKHYCKEDISKIDELYAGDLDDLWNAMVESGYYYENTFYCSDEHGFDSPEECIDVCCDVAYLVE